MKKYLLVSLAFIPVISEAACPAAPVGAPEEPVLQMKRNADGLFSWGATNQFDATEEGAVVWNASNQSLSYCDGTNWIDLGPPSSGDNLGNHAATQNIAIGNNWLSGDGDNEGIAISNSGNVGVGTATPTHKLTLQSGDMLVDNNRHIAWKTSSGSHRTMIMLDSNDNLRLGNTGLGDGNDTISFDITGRNDVLNVLSNGNVGIGTNDPSSTLHVSNTLTVGGGGTVGVIDIRQINNSVTGSISTANQSLELYGFNGIRFRDNSGYVGFKTSGPANWDVYSGSNFTFSGYTGFGGEVVMKNRENDNEVFHAYLADSSNPRVIFPNSTKVGIGTSNPSSTLHLAGDIQLGNENASCTAVKAGAIRYFGDKHQSCDGTSWRDIQTGPSAFPGQIITFAGPVCPNGFLQANGSQVDTATYPELFAVIGTTYGGTASNFNLPDLRGQTIVGVGTGGSFSDYNLADTAGAETITLTTSQMPVHSHSAVLYAEGRNGNTDLPEGNMLANSSGTYRPQVPAIDVALDSASVQIGESGGTQAVDIRQPSIALNYCIAF